MDLKIDGDIRKKSERILKTRPVSQGFVSFIYARQMCKHTQIINFDPNCCKSNRNYKYYHTNSTKFVCCSKKENRLNLNIIFTKIIKNKVFTFTYENTKFCNTHRTKIFS